MMKVLKLSSGVELGWPDYVLTFIAMALAAYSAGYGLGVPEVGYFFILWIGLGIVFSMLMRHLLPEKAKPLDGIFFLIGGVLSAVQGVALNNLLPSEGFPAPLRLAGWLCWMMTFGSFFLWRDATILFEAVPGISLFGLVGTWDTFKSAPFLFFGFLLCYSTLFARSHGRIMMNMAMESGFRPDAKAKGNRLWDLLRRGPWRWMAGPEWALGSAAAVVLISILGAPVLQSSTAFISQNIKIPQPPRPQRQTFQSADASASPSTDGPSVVGNGRRKLTKTIIMQVHMDGPHYLRVRTFDRYVGVTSDQSGGTWYPVATRFVNKSELQNAEQDPNSLISLSLHEDHGGSVKPFSVEYIGTKERNVPLPGDFTSVDHWNDYILREDGTLRPNSETSLQNPTSGEYLEPDPKFKPTDAGVLPNNPEYSNRDGKTPIPLRVRNLALQVTKDARNDYDKALAIENEVSRRLTYDLNTDATPNGADPVEYALFTSHKAYCEVFASSVVLMARAVNLPARYVDGYFPFQEKTDRPEFYTVHLSDAHAWAEIFFKDRGWVVFDSTVDANAVEGAGPGSTNDDGAWYEQAWVHTSLIVLLVTAGVGGIVFLSFSAKKNLGPIGTKQRSEAGKIYAELLTRLQKSTGKPHRPSQTASEYLQTVRPLLNGAFAPSERATAKFVEVYYGSTEPTPQMLAELKHVVQMAKNALKNVRPPKEPRVKEKRGRNAGLGESEKG